MRAPSGLSHSQTQIWVGQILHPDSPLYNMAFAFVIDGAVDPGAFQGAWRRIIGRSDVLRTSIDKAGGIGTRSVRDASRYETVILDFTGDREPEDAFRAWARERCARPMPLDGELVESALAKLADDRWGWYLNQHHLVTDASSTVLLVRRMAGEYAAELARTGGAVSPVPAAAEAPAAYYDIMPALESSVDARTREAAARHWTGRLRTGGRMVPFYGRQVAPSTTRSERITVTLDDAASQRLRDIAASPGFLSFTPDISLFALFATLLAAWLHRVGGRREIDLDAPAHNRPTQAAKGALGLFIELFPFAVRVEPGDSFRDLGRACLAETQQFLRFALPGTSAPSGTTSSNVVLNFFPGTFGSFAGLRIASEWMHPGHADTVHAVRLQVHDYDGTGRYTLQFDLNVDVFPPLLRARTMAHFRSILDSCLRDPDQAIEAVDLLTPDERRELLERFNDTGAAPLPECPITVHIARQARQAPDRTALRQGDRELTFAGLHRQVRTAASRLLRLGVRPGEPVAIFMKRSIEAVIAMLAVLEARGAYVPLDVGYPAGRVRHILADSGARRVIVAGRGLPDDDSWSAEALRIEDLLIGDPAPDTLPAPELDDLAYIIYTSGSTGTPKGVPIEHRGLADYLEWASRQYVRGDRLAFPLFTSLGFDLTITSLYLPLITGGTLLIYPEPDGPVDAALMDVIGENAVDVIKLTPSHLSLLRQMDLSATRIRRMVVGGEDFPARLATAISVQAGHAIEIFNEYGPTEAVVGCMIHRFDPADPHTRVPIGSPADHVQIYLLTGALAPVPEGVPGELCISRTGLARGYHKRDEETAQRFVRHPFRPGDRLYRTGDLARVVSPGTLEYLGRIDRQLKVSGIRVEPGEVEAALLTHDAVQQCVVLPQHAGDVQPERDTAVDYCARCGIASNVPQVVFDADGVCSICRSYDAVRDHARAYFRDLAALRELFRESAARHRAPYDCMMLMSGGKDSTYALCRLVEMGLRVYAFSFDNGYISAQAKENIRRVVAALGVDHEFASTPAINAIFRDSLTRFSNVCNGCFKTIYTLSLARAREMGIPIIVTGLSRGQFFETRLTEQMFREGRCSPEEVDEAVLAARKAYHRVEDEVSRSLDVTMFEDDTIFDEVRFVDFYRYCDAGLDEILSYLKATVPWMRPSDTGRSTNCLVNDVGIYIHKKERGYHNYAVPYSWDVRMGHKTRPEALEELQDEIDVASVRRMLAEIGYDEDRLSGARGTGLTACYVASRDISPAELRRHLSGLLPAALVPRTFRRIEAMPLTPNGKLDLDALAALTRRDPPEAGDDDPLEGAVQERIGAIWCDVLRLDRVPAHASFFELGGTSLGAMDVVLRICNEFDLDLPLQTLFQQPTIAQLADTVERAIIEDVASLSDEEAEHLAADQDLRT